MLYQFLQHNEMNQSYTYIYPLPLGLPSHSGHHRALSRIPCAIEYVLISSLFCTQYQQCLCGALPTFNGLPLSGGGRASHALIHSPSHSFTHFTLKAPSESSPLCESDIVLGEGYTGVNKIVSSLEELSLVGQTNIHGYIKACDKSLPEA